MGGLCPHIRFEESGRLSCADSRRSGRVAEGGALLRRYGGECLHRGFESLLLRFAARERCPSGLRSATGNRVRAERCVAGSNPALSVVRGGNCVSPTSLFLERRRGCERYASRTGAIDERRRGGRSRSANPGTAQGSLRSCASPLAARSCGVCRRRRALGSKPRRGQRHYASGISFGYLEVLDAWPRKTHRRR